MDLSKVGELLPFVCVLLGYLYRKMDFFELGVLSDLLYSEMLAPTRVSFLLVKGWQALGYLHR